MKKIFFVSIFLIFIFAACLYSADYYYLSDTGQIKCFNDKEVIPCPLSGEDYYGQDANYKGVSRKFTVKDINGDKVVQDENTYLMWQQGTADTNKDGKISENDMLNWQDADNYCENLTYAGYSDWRLPRIFELSTTINYGKNTPVIDETIFECLSSNYWSSTIYQVYTKGSWNINFGNGNVSWGLNSYKFYVRCVRGKVSDNFEEGRFVSMEINKESLVKDNLTELMWMKKTADIDNNGSVETDNDTVTWIDALKYCENLNYASYDDWRLPNIQELRSIIKYDTYSPAIDKSVFEIQSSKYWSSTTDTVFINNARGISYYYGNDISESKLNHNYVMCVRGGVAKANPGIIKVNDGWNLKSLPVYNEIGVNMDNFKNNNIITIWKWSGTSWEIWSPDDSVMELILKYGISKIEKISTGEGFWINAKDSVEINVGIGDDYGLEKIVVNDDWNLSGIGEDTSISEFGKLEGIKTVWKWSGSGWQIWSPIESIMQLISDYGLTSINEIEKGEGFWVNK